MAEQNVGSRLESLPTDLQIEIVARVASASRDAVGRVMLASKVLAVCAPNPQVYRSVNLQPLTYRPLAALHRYRDLMERCLASGNLQAHYICGIQLYFHANNIDDGLPHLRFAAEGSYDESVYLYSMILLCSGEARAGEQMLDSLGWRVKKKRADKCWKKVKRSLHGVNVVGLDSYYHTYITRRATTTCHLDDIDERCNNCYYYKQITKSVFII